MEQVRRGGDHPDGHRRRRRRGRHGGLRQEGGPAPLLVWGQGRGQAGEETEGENGNVICFSHYQSQLPGISLPCRCVVPLHPAAAAAVRPHDRRRIGFHHHLVPEANAVAVRRGRERAGRVMLGKGHRREGDGGGASPVASASASRLLVMLLGSASAGGSRPHRRRGESGKANITFQSGSGGSASSSIHEN